MSYFCHQVSFTTDAWNRVFHSAEDSFQAVRAPVESLGGKVLSAFFALGSYDVLAVSELPESVSPSAIDIALFASGDVAHVHSTQLLTAGDILKAAEKAGLSSDRPLPRALAAAPAA
jgi:uncharacterized protein with GYD domain